MPQPQRLQLVDDIEARLWSEAYVAALNANARFSAASLDRVLDPELVADAAVSRLRERRP